MISFQLVKKKYLGYIFIKSEGIVKIYHRPTFIIFDRSLEKSQKEEEIKSAKVKTEKPSSNTNAQHKQAKNLGYYSNV
jgi:hypothetical protein